MEYFPLFKQLTGGTIGHDVFFHPLLGLIVTSNEYGMLTRLLKFKLNVFRSSESEDGYEFILDLYERLRKLVISRQQRA